MEPQNHPLWKKFEAFAKIMEISTEQVNLDKWWFFWKCFEAGVECKGREFKEVPVYDRRDDPNSAAPIGLATVYTDDKGKASADFYLNKKAVDKSYWLAEQTAKASQARMEMLEELAAAYLIRTKLPPGDVELVERSDGSQVIWYFRKKGSGD